MKYIYVFKVVDENLLNSRYEIWKDKKFYTSNISTNLKNRYIRHFQEKGYIILNGKNVIPE